ncbi:MULTISPECIES: MFS transporter [Ignavibacterium]|jgi:MFS family permease|uniref:MFS transporter n=1 Tax=Ignavibacterium TaxID=795750 RepID=UPI0025BAF835|nr:MULTISPECIES: MFS transporter [Ignavibacterium]MBI5662968.1 MFS transporter [Ignavibacterium album]
MATRNKIHKQVILLGMVSFFTDIASEMLYPVTPIFLTAVLGSSMALVGIIEGSAELIAALLKGYFGNLSDKLGRRSIFVTIGYSLSAISKPLPGILPNIPIVFATRVADRIGKGIRTAPRDALLGSYSNNNSGAVFGFHRSMDTLGAAIGPFIALVLLNIYPDNYNLIFLVAFVPSIIAVTFTLLIKDKSISSEKRIKKSYLEFFKSSPKSYKRILVLLAAFSLVNSSDVFLILKSRDISESSSLAIFGYIFYNIIYAASSYPMGSLSDKLGKKNVFTFGLILFSMVYFGFALSKDIYLLWILFALYGIYAASTEGISKAWISDLIPDESRGTAIGLATFITGVCVMLGSFATGLLWDKFGSQFPFIVSASVSLVLSFIVWFKK